MFSDSDVRYLDPGELPENPDKKHLAAMEILARHGEKFDDDEEMKVYKNY